MLICCKKRKKTPLEIDLDQRERDAYARIKSSLDILNIIRLFNLLKVITHLFFEDYHFDLAQYVGFDLWRKEVKMRMERAKVEREKEEIELKNLSKSQKEEIRKVKSIELEKKRFAQSVKKLSERVGSEVKFYDELNPKITGWVDTFYYLHAIGEPQLSHHFQEDDLDSPCSVQPPLDNESPPRTSTMLKEFQARTVSIHN